MAEKKKKPGTKPDAKPEDSGDDDWALWKKVAGSVEPLPGRKLEKTAPRDSAPDTPRRKQPASNPPPPPSSAAEPDLPELVAGSFAGLDKRTAQRLKRGQLRPEARLDLHHMTQAEAHKALNMFVSESALSGKRTVIVITGKGLKRSGEVGVLRTMVPRWLNQPPLRGQIVAVCEAAPQDGGSGALYLRLKKFG